MWIKLSGLETVLYLHEFSNYSLLGKLRIYSLTLFSDKIITVDAPNFMALQQRYWLKKKIYHLSRGSQIQPMKNIERGEPEVETACRDNRKLRALYFGFIRAGKGIETMLHTFNNNEEIRQHWELHVVGGLSDSAQSSEQSILDDIKKSSFVTYHDYLPGVQLQKVFAECDVFLLPFDEGLTERRGSFMAGMAFGKPIITTKPLYPIDGLQNDINIFFLEHLTSAELERALRQVEKLPTKILSEIGTNAKIWYDMRYSDEIFFGKLLQILGNGGPGASR
jgi:glycosyltransferase involved in cell wall biosynthesis